MFHTCTWPNGGGRVGGPPSKKSLVALIFSDEHAWVFRELMHTLLGILS